MVERINSPHSDQCVICQTPDARYHRGDGASEQDCARCGRFKITGTAIAELRAEDDMAVRTCVSHYVRRNNGLMNAVPKLTSAVLSDLRQAKPPTIEQRAETLFAYLIETSAHLGAPHETTDPGLDGAAGSLIGRAQDQFCDDETLWLLKMLEERSWLREQDGDYEVTPHGYAAWDKSARERAGLRTGFIAMPFALPLSDAIQGGAQRAIIGAGYEPFVVSDAEHIGRIDDLIVSGLRMARLLVSDLTYQRQNVYWESGFCAGLGTPVFLSCHQDHVAQLHFDIRQYNTVVWSDLDDLATKLQRRIEAVIGKGPQ